MFRADKHQWSMKLMLSILPVVLVMIVIFFFLTANSIVSLTSANMSLYTENCLDDLGCWTDNVISELNIYKQVIENNFYSNEELTRFISTTYEANDAYPMGIYIGDDTGFYADASGWIPDDDWVLVERPWYVDGKNSNTFVFGEPYTDSMLGTTCISASARLKYNNAVRVMTADVYLDYAQQLVTDVASNNIIDGAMFITEKDQIVLADSNNKVSGNKINDGSELAKTIADMLNDHKTGQTKIKCDGISYYITIKQNENTGWYLVTYVRSRTVLGYLYKVELVMAIVAVAASLTLAFITKHYAKKMANMQKMVKSDRLTGIINRQGIEEIISDSLGEAPSNGVLIICDLDNFKSINDNLGHPEGDKVLRDFANLLSSFFNRRNDFVARLGGDEFAVFIGYCVTEEALEKMLSRFTEQVKERYHTLYSDYDLSASAGAAFVSNRRTFFELYRAADNALYEVKNNGKNGYKIVIDDDTQHDNSCSNEKKNNEDSVS